MHFTVNDGLRQSVFIQELRSNMDTSHELETDKKKEKRKKKSDYYLVISKEDYI